MILDQNKISESVTVIIPAYNSALSLPSCLESVLNQSCPPVEIVVVDDGSTDETGELLSKYPVKQLRLPRRMGAAYARVAGARAAKGSILAFLDADCIAGPDWLRDLVGAMSADVAGVGGGYRFENGHNLFETFISRLARDWFSQKQPEGRAILIGGNAAFRKEVFLGRQYFWELSHRRHFASGDDTLLCLEILEKHKLDYLPGSPVTHQSYGTAGFFRRQIRWAKSRTSLFLKPPVKQRTNLASGPIINLLSQILSIGFVVLSSVLALSAPFSVLGLPLFVLSVLLFFFSHLNPLSVLTEQRRFTLFWIPAAFFLWLRGLCYIMGIAGAFFAEMVNAAGILVDKLVFARDFFDPKRLFKIYVFVTNRCNQRCDFCFYRNKLTSQNDQDTLMLNDYQKISDNLPTIPYLTLTGGEPFLRNDLDQIALRFYKKNRVRYLVIPTNGTLPRATEDIIERLLIDAPHLNLTVQVSLNGLEDYFFNGKNSEETAVVFDTWDRLYRLQKRFRNLKRNLSLVITQDNSDVLEQLVEKISVDLKPDHFFITPQRSGPGVVSLPHITTERFVSVLQKMQMSDKPTFFDHIYRFVYKTVERHFVNVYRTGKMPAPCLAGKKFLVIDPEGEVKLCELRDDKIENVLDHKWKNIASMGQFTTVLNSVYHENCVCTWGCAIVSNTIHRFSVLNS